MDSSLEWCRCGGTCPGKPKPHACQANFLLPSSHLPSSPLSLLLYRSFLRDSLHLSIYFLFIFSLSVQMPHHYHLPSLHLPLFLSFLTSSSLLGLNPLTLIDFCSLPAFSLLLLSLMPVLLLTGPSSDFLFPPLLAFAFSVPFSS